MHARAERNPPTTVDTSPLVCKLSRLHALSPASVGLLRDLPRDEELAAGQTWRPSWGQKRRNLIVASGWAAQYRLLRDGRRLIVALLLPGDHLGVTRQSSARVELPLIALTHVTFLDGDPLAAALAASEPRHEALDRALEDADLLTCGQMVDHLMRLGRQTGLERIAHLIAELRDRLRAAGGGDGGVFPLPLTQAVLADTLGLSIVHVNRTLKQLRRHRILELASGTARILNAGAFEDLSDFQPPLLVELRGRQ